MSLFSKIRTYAKHVGERRRYRETERTVRNLPLEVQKDIGWPGTAYGIECADEPFINRR